MKLCFMLKLAYKKIYKKLSTNWVKKLVFKVVVKFKKSLLPLF